ncbi:MAG: NAD(P)/FAD-dependent oxidoreductase [Lachnospiraceae bacterium]|nr:NAD(P)/FAD-dependent oxidoreductase [Lachnospiraceae bacterium]
MNKRVVVIGGGPAGMMAAYASAVSGADVTLIEKNEKLGKKLFITGKGRCNLTNACEDEEFFKNVVSNPKFLYSAYYGFNNNALMELVSGYCPLKVERGNRVFPRSDHSSDIIKAFSEMLKEKNVRVILNTTVKSVKEGAVLTTSGEYKADSIVIATGGISYPSTGSTGDGYLFAEKFGHTVTEPRSALAGLICEGEECALLQGLSLKNIEFTLKGKREDKKTLYKGFGEMLFTHFGISGPVVLSASSYYSLKCNGNRAYVSIDLKKALSDKELDERLIRDFNKYNNRSFKNSLSDLLPSKLIPVIIGRSGIDENKKVNLVSKEERLRLGAILKNFDLTVSGIRPVEEAIITQGGVNTKEIDPSTMGSKIQKGIYFAGEVIDTDALTGGFNLQTAFSTGYLAGSSAAE